MKSKFITNLSLMALIFTALLIFSCKEQPNKKNIGLTKNMSVSEFAEVVESPDSVVIIDVESYAPATIYIAGAIAQPISSSDEADAIITNYGIVFPFAVYDIDGFKSARAAKLLAERGAMVYNLTDGLVAWVENDRLIMLIDESSDSPIAMTKSQFMADTTLMCKKKNIAKNIRLKTQDKTTCTNNCDTVRMNLKKKMGTSTKMKGDSTKRAAGRTKVLKADSAVMENMTTVIEEVN